MERRITLKLIEGGRDTPGVLTYEHGRAATRLRLILRRKAHPAPSLLHRLQSVTRSLRAG